MMLCKRLGNVFWLSDYSADKELGERRGRALGRCAEAEMKCRRVGLRRRRPWT
jgi:hypothetical protein